MNEDAKIILFALGFMFLILGFMYFLNIRCSEVNQKVSECVIQNKELPNPRDYCSALIYSQKKGI